MISTEGTDKFGCHWHNSEKEESPVDHQIKTALAVQTECGSEKTGTKSGDTNDSHKLYVQKHEQDLTWQLEMNMNSPTVVQELVQS